MIRSDTCLLGLFAPWKRTESHQPEAKVSEVVLEITFNLWPVIMIKKTWKIISHHKWDKVFKSGSSKICGKQPLKNEDGL